VLKVVYLVLIVGGVMGLKLVHDRRPQAIEGAILTAWMNQARHVSQYLTRIVDNFAQLAL
jgi:hypothetical protein